MTLRGLHTGRLSAVAVWLGLAAGCGGGGGDAAATYRREGDSACARAYAATARLPQLQHDERLHFDEVRARGKEISRRFDAEMEALDPPEDLVGSHAQLLREIKRPLPPGRATFARLEDIRRRYATLGLQGCADGVTRSLRVLRRAREVPR